jgi:hypothetical protein
MVNLKERGNCRGIFYIVSHLPEYSKEVFTRNSRYLKLFYGQIIIREKEKKTAVV